MVRNIFTGLKNTSRLITYGVFTFIIKVMLVTFLGILYWLSTLQEKRMYEIKGSLNQIQGEIAMLKSKRLSSQLVQKATSPVTKSVHVDPSLPNLLIKDPFFSEILPHTLLPKGFVPRGTLRTATYDRLDNLLPFSQWNNVNDFLDCCRWGAVSHQFGKRGVLVEGFAEKIEERPGVDAEHTEFWVHLRPDIYWQPLERRHFPPHFHLSSHFTKKHPVTAYDFQFWWDALHNPHLDLHEAVALRHILRNMEKVKALDERTLVVIAKRSLYVDENQNKRLCLPYLIRYQLLELKPFASFVYQYFPNGTKICPLDSENEFYQKSFTWAQNFTTHFASHVIPSCGPWVFDGMNEQRIRFRRNPDFYDLFHALNEVQETYFFESPDSSFIESPESMWRDFVTKKIDFCTLTPNMLIEFQAYLQSSAYSQERAQGNDIRRLDYCDRSFAYIGWNQKNPLFASKKVRRALTLAIDRKRIIEQILSGQGIEISGPFLYHSAEYDKSIESLPFDPEEAKRLLAEEGFIDLDGDGIIEKDVGEGRVPFRFTLTFYVKKPTDKVLCELIASQLRAIGVDCVLHGVGLSDLSAASGSKSFDAICLAWLLDTYPTNPRQIWHSEGANSNGSSNEISFANSEVDSIIERLDFEGDPQMRQKLYNKLHAILHEEAPYVFLYTPKSTLVWWNRIDNVFIPKDRQDLILGADSEKPNTKYSWLRK